MRIKIDIRIKRGKFFLNKRAVALLGAKPGQVLRMIEDEDGNVLLNAMDDPEDMYTGKLTRMSTAGMSCSNTTLAEEILHGMKSGSFRIGEVIDDGGTRWVSVITRKNYAN